VSTAEEAQPATRDYVAVMVHVTEGPEDVLTLRTLYGCDDTADPIAPYRVAEEALHGLNGDVRGGWWGYGPTRSAQSQPYDRPGIGEVQVTLRIKTTTGEEAATKTSSIVIDTTGSFARAVTRATEAGLDNLQAWMFEQKRIARGLAS
jgi:hypothetical protein